LIRENKMEIEIGNKEIKEESIDIINTNSNNNTNTDMNERDVVPYMQSAHVNAIGPRSHNLASSAYPPPNYPSGPPSTIRVNGKL